MDGGAWWATALGAAESWTRLSNSHFQLGSLGQTQGLGLRLGSCLPAPIQKGWCVPAVKTECWVGEG